MDRETSHWQRQFTSCTLQLRRYVGDQRVIVFVNTQRQCDVVANVLYDRGYSSCILHGGKSQVCDLPA